MLRLQDIPLVLRTWLQATPKTPLVCQWDRGPLSLNLFQASTSVAPENVVAQETMSAQCARDTWLRHSDCTDWAGLDCCAPRFVLTRSRCA